MENPYTHNGHGGSGAPMRGEPERDSHQGAFWRARLGALAHGVILAEGWQRALIAFGAGAIGALALAPFNLTPALILTLSVAVFLLDGAVAAPRHKMRARFFTLPSAAPLLESARDGWCLGFGYFCAGLWWLGSAFLVEADRFAWALPLGVICLPAILALFTAAGFMAAKLLWSSSSLRIFGLAAGLGGTEWLRGHLFTGFPWNLFGMALATPLALAQGAALVGIYGLTFFAVAICASFALLADEAHIAAHHGRLPRLFVVCLIALIALFGYGTLRLGVASPAMVKGVKLRLMQPNIAQDAHFNASNKEQILNSYLTLSDRAKSPTQSGVADITHLIWPESAFPFILARDGAALAQIGALLPKGAVLITGAARAGERDANGRITRYYNAIEVVGSDGTILGGFDKVHLVPFGEYLPYADTLQALGITQFVSVPGGFSAGVRRTLMEVAGLPPALPLICYEAIFPDEIASSLDEAQKRPALLLNVTDDAWFGGTPGPFQHYAMARLRTIEQGLPLVRAGNNGITAVVNAYGREVASLPLGVADVLDSALPVAIAPPFYARHGETISLCLFLLFAVAALLGKLTSR